MSKSQTPLPKDAILFGQQGSYNIVSVIGHGGFGVTYLAEASGPGLPELVYIKEFYPKQHAMRSDNGYDLMVESNHVETIAKLRHRFISESRNVAALSHNGIVRVYDTVEANGTAYMVMEYIKGRTLKQVAQTFPGNRLDPGVARTIMRDVAKSVAYLHSRNMTHLDIKPDNIMLTQDGKRLVLIDFGLSRSFTSDGRANGATVQITAVSPGYSAPEQYAGATGFSPQSDVYSLGATLYTLLTGLTPPEPAAMDGNPAALTFGTHIAGNIQYTVRQAMAYNRTQRTPSAAHMAIQLGATDTPPPPPGAAPVPGPAPHPVPGEDNDDDNKNHTTKGRGTAIALNCLTVTWILFLAGQMIANFDNHRNPNGIDWAVFWGICAGAIALGLIGLIPGRRHVPAKLWLYILSLFVGVMINLLFFINMAFLH